MEELNKANKLLSFALERYHSACSTLLNSSQRTSNLPRSQTLLDCVENELSSISIYEAIMERAKAAVSRTRNMIRTPASWTILPDEIWGHVFCLVRDMHPCYLQEKTREDHKLAQTWYPELFTHVCYRWRRIAIGHSPLWTHIDIIPRHSQSKQFYDRGMAFVSRSEGSPRTLHIDDRYGSTHDAHADLSVFLAQLSTRIDALEVAFDSCRQPFALQSCLANCVPGTLRQLSLTDTCDEHTCIPIDRPGLIADGANSSYLDLHEDSIERTMIPIQKLYLTACYFHWGSRAYAGLTELHLLPHSDRMLSITQSELVQVLASSPQLRMLRIGIRIAGGDTTSPLVPVRLKNLEVLDFRFGLHEVYPTFFALLSPKTKPLQMSLRYFSRDDSPLNNSVVKKFFSASKITQLYMNGPFEGIQLLDLLALLPHLRTLVLSNFSMPFGRSTSPNIFFSLWHPPLETLRLVNCTIGVPELQAIAEMHPIKALIVQGCNYRLVDGTIAPDRDEHREAYFIGTASTVRFVEDPPSIEMLYSGKWDPWE
ncbi:hypothetical protein B0J17DRAFT_664237 [Rhizoctonia solani]|nr:hypothetical protein B0J17DRAFT_664237 [Rhizoctonia solani]